MLPDLSSFGRSLGALVTPLILHQGSKSRAPAVEAGWVVDPRVSRVRRGNGRITPLIRRFREQLAAISFSE